MIETICDKCQDKFMIPEDLKKRIDEAKKDNPEVKSYCPKCSNQHLAMMGSLNSSRYEEQHGEPDDYYS